VPKRASEQHEPQTSMKATTIAKARPAWKATCRVHGAEQEGIASVDSVGALLCAPIGTTLSLRYICPLHDFAYLHDLRPPNKATPRALAVDESWCFTSFSFHHNASSLYRLSVLDTATNPLVLPYTIERFSYRGLRLSSAFIAIPVCGWRSLIVEAHA